MSLKKLVAVLAVSGPLVASAQQAAAPAPAPLYQIYGTLNLNTQYIEVSGAEQPGGRNMSGRLAVSTDSTNVGIRGTADTGQFGLGVVYQCETSATLDGDGAAVLVCNRNSRLGLTSEFGTFFYGNWDTPYKALLYGTKGDDPFGNTDVYDVAAIIGSPGLKTRSSGARSVGGTGATTVMSFNQRAGNSVAWHSPKFGPVQVKAQYSTNEYQNRRGDIAPALYSAGLNFDLGTISGGVAYERHSDYAQVTVGGTPTAPTVGLGAPTRSTTDQGIKAGAGIELPSGVGATTIGAQVEWLQNALNNATTNQLDNMSRWAYMIGLKHRMGNHELRVRFSQALEAKVKIKGGTSETVNDSGASNYALGYAYYLSKAAQIYAYGTLLDNQKFATYTFATGGPAQLTSTAAGEDWTAGADPMAIGLGLRYAF